MKILLTFLILLSSSKAICQRATQADIQFSKYYNSLLKTKPDSILVFYKGNYDSELRPIAESLRIICLSLKKGKYEAANFSNISSPHLVQYDTCKTFGLLQANHVILEELNTYSRSGKPKNKAVFKNRKIVSFEIVTAKSNKHHDFYRLYNNMYNYDGELINDKPVYVTFGQLLHSITSLSEKSQL
jgi:hypothetical protein